MLENVEVFTQSSICIHGNKKVYFDPYQVPKDFHDADFILMICSFILKNSYLAACGGKSFCVWQGDYRKYLIYEFYPCKTKKYLIGVYT